MSQNRVAVVTGSNQGIGFATVKALCSDFEGSVYLTSRNEERGLAAVEELKKIGLQPKYHQLDINDESSVLRLRDYLKDTYGGLDVLVNNAAILLTFKEGMSDDIFAEHACTVMQTNYFDTQRACKILFPILKPHARVVNLSSMLGHLTHIPGEDSVAVNLRAKLASPDLTYEELDSLMHNFVDAAQKGEHTKYGWPATGYYTTYIVSKIGVSALTRIQHRDFERDSRENIVINHVHPGYVSTQMSDYKGVLTPEKGAVAPSWLALLPPNVQEPKGAFVWCDKTIVDWVKGPMPPLD
ncbi:Carbonyl reductase [NADPH] 1 [Daphnia magna]|uniref:carbonyl reductase (NADPH) n=1 Tax=Daphnia magna TaxID=35525 RepID=A0A164KTZ5_9CRUS|nr:Carbonyl reductase [NADPH] 1 [Daphnia magna]